MNRSHKVVWNKVRRAYVATDENKLSHCKKSCKAILGIALISLFSPTVIAETLTIDNAYIEGIGTTKLIDGKDKNFEYSSIEVKTEGDFRKLANAVKDKNFSAIRSALGYDGTNATPVFLAGGRNYIDKRTSLTLGTASLALGFKGGYDDLKNKVDLIKDNTESIKGVSTNIFLKYLWNFLAKKLFSDKNNGISGIIVFTETNYTNPHYEKIVPHPRRLCQGRSLRRAPEPLLLRRLQ